MRDRFARIPISVAAPARLAYTEGRSIWLPTPEHWIAEFPEGANLVGTAPRRSSLRWKER
jgi:hypothetical protein